jgi:geranylgeranyl pyrophosphate synthase
MIHAYSLIHDDLPAMDNADLRRGKPSCHKAFDEATAILAGDALQTLAFEIIANHPGKITPDQRLTMIQTLAEKSGLQGMAGGQALDMEGVSDIQSLTTMYSLKTGALITASVKLGMQAGKNQTPLLLDYAKNLGIAFQLQDDLLDIESSADMTGKTSGLDVTNQKMTFPHFLGIEKTREKINLHFKCALDALNTLKGETDTLRALTEYLFQRKK